MTQLRFHIGTEELSSLKIIEINLFALAPEHRALIRKHLDDGNDVWAHTWSRLRDGQRTEFSEVTRANHRVIAKEANLPSLIEALQANEQDLLKTRSYTFSHIAA